MAQKSEQRGYHGSELAIIGLSGRFPGAHDIRQFWHNLRDGVESIRGFTAEEMRACGADPSWLEYPSFINAGGAVDGIDQFDAGFFGFSPREAEITDPEHRLFLECSWEALERAGYDPHSFPGSIGVFAGAGMSGYLYNLVSNDEALMALGWFRAMLGNDKDYLATWVSYKLDLRGPSLSIQTACSTSLVATHVACQSLLNGECDMALAGGASLNASQHTGYFFQEGGIQSRDGHCRAFDADAAGSVPGNGVAVVLLKRLDDALADGDRIHAVIKGSAINNDGSSKLGFTAPSLEGQARAISEAMAMAEVEPESIGYIEAHGTGTQLGDPVEVAALTRAFRAATEAQGFCALGSVKTNVGHLDAAAGVAGLIKTALALEHRQIPASLHFERPNPELDLEESPFYVNTELACWAPRNGHPRRAGVSSFGLGGTNAHVILEEAPPPEPPTPSRPYQTLVLSAATQTALDRSTRELASWLQETEDATAPLADLAFTLQVGRRAFEHRRVIVCRDRDQAISAIEAGDAKRILTHRTDHRSRGVAFLFPGQGTQYVGMGREIYETEPIFREHLDRCFELLESEVGVDFHRLLYGDLSDAAEILRQTANAQPAIVALEIALARLLMSWGVRPEAMLGHSLGEYSAACLAGVFDLADALLIVAARGRMMQRLPPGAMLSVALTEERIAPYLDSELSLAALNHPTSTVVSGERQAVEGLHEQLTEEGIQSFFLETSHAGHSPMLRPMVEEFGEVLAGIELRPPEIPFLSNRSGTWITDEEATDPRYWAEHLLHTVRFNQGIEELYRDPDKVLLEVGPGTTLGAFARWHPERSKQQPVYSSMRHPEIEGSDAELLQEIVGRLWLAGVAVDWQSLYRDERRRRLPLWTYPFERRRYWVNAGTGSGSLLGSQAAGAGSRDLSRWFYAPSWRKTYLDDPSESRQLPTSWLLFVDSGGLGETIAARLRELGARVETVQPGEGFLRLEAGGYAIDPAQRSDYSKLVEELWTGDEPPTRIVHLWSIGDASTEEVEPTDHVLERGFFSLTYLGQVLGERLLPAQVTLAAVADGLLAVTGEESLKPEKATLLGPAKILPVEIENLRCRILDIAVPESHGGREHLAGRLIDDFAAETSEAVVAWRGHSRWAQLFEPLTLASADDPPARLRRGGVYLLAGGVGGIGLEIAGYLAKEVGARLILTGRTPLPSGSRREVWLEQHGPHDPVSMKLLKLQELEAAGAEMMVAAVDVTDQTAMEELVEQARQRFGSIHGVIHAAGPPPGSLTMLENAESLEPQLASKLRGVQVLEQIFADGELDFLFLCSTLNSIRPLPGRLAYCAANAFLDAYAHAREGDRTFVQSVNWDTWREVGMAVVEARRMGIDPEESIGGGISPEEGVEAFVRAARRQLPQIVVSHRDFEALLREGESFSASQALEELEQAQTEIQAHPRPDLSTPYVAPRNDTEQTIAEVWQQLLGIDKVGIHDNFFELGGDSVVSIQVIARTRKAGLSLAPRQVFDLPTIAELAASAGSGPEIVAEQGPVTGSLPLTPIQSRFFERPAADPAHWNQSVLLEANEGLDVAALRGTVGHLLAQHDALRLSFHGTLEEGIEQRMEPLGGDPPVHAVDLSALPLEAHREQQVAMSSMFQRSFELSRAPLLRIALFDFGAGRSQRLLIILHHLVVDAISWQILLEDLESGYGQLRAGATVELPAKTTSFKYWAERLAQYASGPEHREELEYWLGDSRQRVLPLPLDLPRGANTVDSVRSLSTRLSEEETLAVLQGIPQIAGVQSHEILLTALAKAVAGWTGQRLMLVDQEGHGREPLFPEIDVSRTVGWFTNIFPIFLDLEDTIEEPLEELKAIKEQLRGIPNRGMGYGLSRYLAPLDDEIVELRSQPRASMSFVYLGQLGRALDTGPERPSSPLRAAEEPHGATQCAGAERNWVLELVASVDDNQLELIWTYSKNLHHRTTIDAFAERLATALREIIARCQSSGDDRVYTPSDFTKVDLDQAELDELVGKLSS